MFKHNLRGVRNAIRVKQKPVDRRKTLTRQNAVDIEQSDKQSSANEEQSKNFTEEIQAAFKDLQINYELPEDPEIRRRWIEGMLATRSKFFFSSFFFINFDILIKVHRFHFAKDS